MGIKKAAKKILPKSEYAKDSIISVVGVGVAAIIPILIYPFLGRIFTPEDFNLMNLFVAIAGVLGVTANLRYANAVAIATSDEDAKNALALSIIFSFFSSLLFFLLLVFFGKPGVSYFNLDTHLSDWLYFIPISTFLISICIGFNGWLTRKKRFTAMAINKSVRRGGEGIIQLSLGKIKLSTGLIYGVFIGDILNFFVHYFQFKKAQGNFSGLTFLSLKQSAKRFIDFPKYNLIPSLLDTLSLYLPFFIINSLYSDAISGQFAQSRAILAIPLTLISMAVSQVLLQKLSEKRILNQAVFPFLKRQFLFLTGLGIVGVLIIYPFGEVVFKIFLGPQWGQAGEMASLMVFAYALKFIITPLSVVFFAIEKIKVSSFWQIGYFGGMCILFFLPDVNINTFIYYYVIIEIVFYLIYLLLIINTSKKFDAELESNK